MRFLDAASFHGARLLLVKELDDPD